MINLLRNHKRTRLLIGIIGGVVLFFGIAVLMYFLGNRNASTELTFRHATPDQIAQAMKNDEFFSEYGQNILIVQGTISSTSLQNGALIADLQTNSSSKVECKIQSNSSPLHIQETITFVTIAENAEREDPNGVLLQSCSIIV